MVSAKGSSAEINFFETGYILINDTRFDVEEISINMSRDMNPYHVAAQRDPVDQRPGRNKIDFSFKRAFGDAVFLKIYQNSCNFEFVLINNDAANVDGTGEAQKVVMLEGCRISQNNIGPVNGGDVVSEDIQGSATGMVIEMDKITTRLAKRCSASGDAA